MASKNNFAAVVLAAGVGKRMKSKTSKVLHEVAGKPIITRTVGIVASLNPSQIVIVASSQNAKDVKRILNEKPAIAIQKEALGTADATKAGLTKIKEGIKDIAVLYGDDTAFYKPQTILNVFALHRKTSAKITFVTLEKENPSGLGRIVRENGKLIGIVEEKDATKKERQIKEINDGLYFFSKDWLLQNLSKLLPSPVTGEYYLTDLIKIALSQNQKVETYKLKDPGQWHGINTPEELEEANSKLKNKIHIMGIVGAGAAAVAGIAKAYGFKVSGCDISPQSAYSKGLGIKVQKGHDSGHLKAADMLIISPAVLKLDPKNREVAKAKSLKIPVSTWQEFQGEYLQEGKFVIAVAGAYGKSTTTAMVSQILIDAGLDPTCEVGAKVLSWDKNFRVGKSKYFVCEADEYNNNFLNYSPDIAVILNIVWEHPDFFKSEKDITASYQKFIDNIKPGGTLITGSDPLILKHRKNVKTEKIGSDPNITNIKLSIIGNFRKENAAAALSVAKALNLDLQKAKKSIENFKGLGRRLELKGEIDGVKFYDDYAVQPYTVKTTADALKEEFKDKKVLLVFEPHTFSRIETFFGDFVSALKKSNVDKIYITEVFTAREKGNKKTLAKKLAKKVGKKAKFTGSLAQTAQEVKDNLGKFEIVLSMGAGDIYKLYDFFK
ncbi:MAG: sugar phosphate nucleotidyltransferase [Candidatus Curtissbacteria bacterium]|nr:sugar phosphate nucleotidyltransferase [Candidatus Curtissbacteria bacterium]